MTDRDAVSRRAVLQTVAGAGFASVAGCSAFEGGSDDAASTVEGERAEELARRFAPTLYFDQAEPWFPTDPRPYTSEQDGETVVDGFDAFDGYHERMTEGEPPDPTAFYNVVEYENSSLAVVQFWFYSAFDQFTTNFHWHDWEVLHVFVDTGTGDPQLYVASSHSRKVPNNEFLDPDPEMVPRILSELGSHSSALSVNDARDRFTRCRRATGSRTSRTAPSKPSKTSRRSPSLTGSRATRGPGSPTSFRSTRRAAVRTRAAPVGQPRGPHFGVAHDPFVRQSHPTTDGPADAGDGARLPAH